MKDEKISQHIPVMLSEVLEYLNPQPGDIFVDGTLGLGGHAEAFLKRLGLHGRLIGIDKDGRSLKVARQNLKAFEQQCTFVHDDYRNIPEILKALSIDRVDGIFLDLGISSFQMDDPERGFSIRNKGPLDMRMDQENSKSALDLLQSLSENELSTILREWGEERWHQRIARALVVVRAQKPIETTDELADVVLKAIPRERHWTKIHPATRTFQALRIAVNQELESLSNFLRNSSDLLKPSGRLGVIAFHSLEDRMVKLAFRAEAKAQQVKLLTKKPLRPTATEIKTNPRSRSARFRAVERI